MRSVAALMRRGEYAVFVVRPNFRVGGFDRNGVTGIHPSGKPRMRGMLPERCTSRAIGRSIQRTWPSQFFDRVAPRRERMVARARTMRIWQAGAGRTLMIRPERIPCRCAAVLIALLAIVGLVLVPGAAAHRGSVCRHRRPTFPT
jgi:hypothetical protein